MGPGGGEIPWTGRTEDAWWFYVRLNPELAPRAYDKGPRCTSTLIAPLGLLQVLICILVFARGFEGQGSQVEVA